MPSRIQRKRTAGWRMPEGAPAARSNSAGGEYNWFHGVLESGAFISSYLHRMRGTCRSKAAGFLRPGTALASIRDQARRKQCVSARAAGCGETQRRGLPRGPRHHGEQGAVQPEETSSITRNFVRTPRYSFLFSLRIFRQAGTTVRSSQRRGRTSSPFVALRQCVLQVAYGNVADRVSGEVPSSLRQLQCDQTRRTPGVAVATCQ